MKRNAGFTLVEIAIVLVIVGLLIGGVLKGREMITNAKLKRINRDHAGIIAAMQTYQDRFLANPGDDDSASTRFAIYSDGVNDPVAADINGNGDGTIDGDWMAAQNTETANFWKHLRAADLVPGDGDDETQPTNAYGGNIGVRERSLLLPGHVIIFGGIGGPIASILDFEVDDGSPSSGVIQADTVTALMDGFLQSSAGPDYLDSQNYFLAFKL